ncbi:protein AATF [Caerostris extrusa]|uniref:Protein AATF n=1 Tax=Caerostris extrusa TaxID=172846 RepID=A0AAV4V457_CAEEX|nr:protein AATF [Caerostris extrusa]
MVSLGEKIAKLTNQAPRVILDPEDEINIDSTAKVFNNNTDPSEENEISDLRKKTAPLLEDVDPTYAGKKVSRHDLGHIFEKDIGREIDDSDNDLTGDLDEEESQSDDFADDDDLVTKKKTLISESEESEGDESYSDEESNGAEDSENATSEELTEQFSNVDVSSEIEKGQAIKNQKEIWNRLLESRIRMQKLLITANKLPQYSSWEEVKEKGGLELKENLNKSYQSMKQLMKSFMELQNVLIERNKEILNANNHASKKDEDHSDEEIPSETDEEIEESNKSKFEGKGIKRKFHKESEETILAKHFKSIIPYRNSVIQKWDEKTKLSTGKVKKSFSAFEESALKLIEQNLKDKTNLIRRTQLKRSSYKIIGKPEPKIENNLEEILKDIIETKSGADAEAIRKQIEIQRRRNKIKRKVDTKASKARKLRYVVHPKLVNFMAPEVNMMPDEASESFLKSIHGGMSLST